MRLHGRYAMLNLQVLFLFMIDTIYCYEAGCASIEITHPPLRDGILDVVKGSTQEIRFNVINDCPDVDDFVINVDRDDAANTPWPLCKVSVTRQTNVCSCTKQSEIQSCKIEDKFETWMKSFRFSERKGRVAAKTFVLRFAGDEPRLETTTLSTDSNVNTLLPSSSEDVTKADTSSELREHQGSIQMVMVWATTISVNVVVLIIVVVVVVLRRRNNNMTVTTNQNGTEGRELQSSQTGRSTPRRGRIYEEIPASTFPRPPRCHTNRRGQTIQPSLHRQAAAAPVRFANSLALSSSYLHPCTTEHPPALEPQSRPAFPSNATGPQEIPRFMGFAPVSSSLGDFQEVPEHSASLFDLPNLVSNRRPMAVSTSAASGFLAGLAETEVKCPVIIPCSQPASPQHAYTGLRSKLPLVSAGSGTTAPRTVDKQSQATDTSAGGESCEEESSSGTSSDTDDERPQPLDLSKTGTYRRRCTVASPLTPKEPAPSFHAKKRAEASDSEKPVNDARLPKSSGVTSQQPQCKRPGSCPVGKSHCVQTPPPTDRYLHPVVMPKANSC